MPHSSASPSAAAPARRHWPLPIALCVLLVAGVVTGGSSHAAQPMPPIAPLLALPLLGWVVHDLLGRPRPPAAITAWIALTALLIALPLVQWLPLPFDTGASAGRAALQADLDHAGVAAAIRRISLTPWNSLAAACAMLPAAAVFLSCIAVPEEALRRIPWVLIALAILSLVLGIVQLGVPREHLLNPFPQWQPALGGLFANPNHQATLLVTAATLAGGRLAAALTRHTADPRRRLGAAYVPALALLLTAGAVPLTGSRAGVILLVLALATLTACLWPAGRGLRAGGVLAGAAGLMLLGALATLRWMRTDAVADLRAPLRDATIEVAGRFAPLGSGVGSFVRVFEQEAPPALLMRAYVNHAHNEYLQWWLEAGVSALIAMALATVAIALTVRGLARRRVSERADGVAALIALLAILAHSFVDYPLRTPALLMVAAALAGLAAAAASTADRPQHRHGPA